MNMNLNKKSGRAGAALSLPLLFVVFAASLAAVAVFSLIFQVEHLTWKGLFQPTANGALSTAYYTVWHIRAPRLVLSILLGAALATAGCLLQAMTRNPLSDPEIMGINQGASCLAVVAILLFGGADSSAVILLAALCGAGLSGLLIYGLTRRRANSSQIVLAGVAISAFMSALTTGTILLYDTQLNEILYWMAGKLSGAAWSDDRLVLFLDIPAMLVSFLLAGTLNVLAQGEETAAGLGVHVGRTRNLLGLLIIVLTGSAVAVAGPIGFVGLIVPHMARRLGGVNYRIVLPLSALLGANLLAAADFAAQWLTYPAETPVGIVTAFLGVPFFLYLLRRKGGGRA